MNQIQPITETPESLRIRAVQILGNINNLVARAEADRDRWKQRHADLTVSTMWVISALMLVIAGLAWACLMLLDQGCK